MTLFFLSTSSVALATTADSNKSDILIDTIVSKWTGDLDEMVKSTVIRILVVSSKTMYYIDKGRRSGIFYELMSEFEKQINKRYASRKKHHKIHIVFIPIARDELIPILSTEKAI